MTVMRAGISFLRSLPGVMQIGLLVLALGGAGDLVYHALPAALAVGIEAALGPSGSHAHVVTVLGMILTLDGVFQVSMRRPT